jgi:hypothetical protein
MADGHYNVLFCQIATPHGAFSGEAVLNRIGGKSFGFSAGMHPADELDPLVCDILQVAKFSTDGLYPKHWNEFAGAAAPPLDFVFTLCDPTAGASLPHWPGRPVTADWRYPGASQIADNRSPLGEAGEGPVKHPTFYRTTQIDGPSIFYREAGPRNAPALLLLHGLPSSSRMFEPLFARLSDRYHLVAPDYPGFGHSD